MRAHVCTENGTLVFTLVCTPPSLMDQGMRLALVYGVRVLADLRARGQVCCRTYLLATLTTTDESRADSVWRQSAVQHRLKEWCVRPPPHVAP